MNSPLNKKIEKNMNAADSLFFFINFSFSLYRKIVHPSDRYYYQQLFFQFLKHRI